MRICPINVCQPKTNVNHIKVSNVAQQSQYPAFKGLKAGFWSLVGTGAGIAIGTALSGGLLVPFMIGGAGTIAGGIYGSSKEKPEEPDDNPYSDWHLRD